MKVESQSDKLHCSFCGKSQDEVKKLIAGGDERSREESLLWEREQPFGMPRDMKERMNRGR